MYCNKCGKEIKDNAKFCDGCGANLQTENPSIKNRTINDIVTESKQIAKGFFSKNFSSVIDLSKSCNSKIGIVLTLINAIVFGLVSCFNVAQTVNYCLKTFTSRILSTSENLFGELLTGYASNGLGVSNLKTPILFNLFLPMLFVALIISAVIVGGIYLLFKLKKLEYKPLNSVFNCIGVSYFPLIISLLINFVVGFFLPQLIPFFFIVGILISLLFLYEGLKSIFEIDRPILEITFLLSAIVLIIIIAINIGLNQIYNSAIDSLIGLIGNEISTGASEMFGFSN